MPDYWFLTPYCLAGATIAMSSGVVGSLLIVVGLVMLIIRTETPR